MLTSVFLFICGLTIIIFGGRILVASAVSLNRVTGISSIIIGATFVSLATTMPEVFVSIFAVSYENHGIAIGNAVGAMIVNISLVLALPLAFTPKLVTGGGIKSKTAVLLAVTVLTLLFCLNLEISWSEGLILIAIFILFLTLNATSASKSRLRPPLTLGDGTRFNYLPLQNKSAPQKCIETKCARREWAKIIAGFVFGQILLALGAFILVEHGENLAHYLNVSETVIGFTIIAIGTSLPELVTAITCIYKKSGGLAIGTVIGANVINCTLLLGVCGIIGGIKGSAFPVSRATVFISIPVLIILTAIASIPIICRGGARRWQGIVLLTSYTAYIIYLMLTQPL